MPEELKVKASLKALVITAEGDPAALQAAMAKVGRTIAEMFAPQPPQPEATAAAAEPEQRS